MDRKEQLTPEKQKQKKKTKRVVVTLTDGRNPDGTLHRVFFYGKTKTEANKKRDEYKLRRSMGVGLDKNITVGEWVDVCLENYRKKVSDIYKKNDAVPYNRLKETMGRMKLADVREVHLQKALDAVAGMSSSTIDSYFYAIKLVFAKAKSNKLIPDNPSEDLECPDGEDGTHRALERWESDCIMTQWMQHRCGIWAMLMLLCGLRRSEMMGLTWDCVDMEKRQLTVKQVTVYRSNQPITVEKTKTIAGSRILPICAPLWDALNTIPESDRHGFICTSAHGKQISSSAFKRGWAGFNLAMQRILNGEDVVQAGRREKLEDKIIKAEDAGRKYILFSVRAHDLRHTFATALYDAGIDVKTAQYYLGHADIRMTLDLYTHLSQERENQQRVQLVNFLDDWLEKGLKMP